MGRVLSRRELFRRGALACVGSSLVDLASLSAFGQSEAPTPPPLHKVGLYSFPLDDEALLEDLEQANFLYFWEQTNPETGIIRDRCNVQKPEEHRPRKHRLHRFWADGAVYWREARLRISSRMRASGHLDALALSSGRSCRTIEDSSITGRTSTPANACGTRKCPRSIRPFCCAAFSPAASISNTARLANWRTKFSTASTGPGCPKIPSFCRTDGRPRPDFCRIAGTTTAK